VTDVSRLSSLTPRLPLYLSTRGAFLDPLFLLVVTLALGLWLSGRGLPPRSGAARAGRVVLWAALAVLWALSTPLVSSLLVSAVEAPLADLDAAMAGLDHDRTALVVLSGGPRTNNPAVPWSEVIDAATQARVIGAARLYHRYGFGVVVASGGPQAVSLGMQELLMELGVPVDRIQRDEASTNTLENAENSARIVRGLGMDHVVLATSAMHLPRAARDFDRIGLTVVRAPVDVYGYVHEGFFYRFMDFVPSSSSLARSQAALHEVLGRFAP
jgi:uncharacterized SAM-binding protein YcdF (DUF218 family)